MGRRTLLYVNGYLAILSTTAALWSYQVMKGLWNKPWPKILIVEILNRLVVNIDFFPADPAAKLAPNLIFCFIFNLLDVAKTRDKLWEIKWALVSTLWITLLLVGYYQEGFYVFNWIIYSDCAWWVSLIHENLGI